jgi:hypothetical protein
MNRQMSSSRPQVAGAGVSVLALLSLVATCCIERPEPASAAVVQAPKGQVAARQARCAKAGNTRTSRRGAAFAQRTTGRRACRRKGAKRLGPVSKPPSPGTAVQTATRRDGFFGGTPSKASSSPQPPSSPPPAPSGTGFRFFSPSSFWNTPLAEDAGLDPDSTALTTAFEKQVALARQAGSPPWINTTDYSVPIYTVPADQPTVPVRLASPFFAPALQSAWSDVPLPADARPAAGSDRTLVVWQPSTDRMWEFWKLARADGEWSAGWGGAMQAVSANPGVYGPDAWPGAKPWWGSSASSLSIAGGLITLEDLQRGRIDHALALAIPNVRAGFYAHPAQRTDGTSSNPLSLPEGAHLRLDPSLDLAALHLPRMTLMLAEAAQRYGIVVRDRAKVTHFFAEDPGPTGANPYLGAGGHFEGQSPGQLLSQFPWDRLQLLKMELSRWG